MRPKRVDLMHLPLRLLPAFIAIAVGMAMGSSAIFPSDDPKGPWTVTPGQRAEKNPAAPSVESVGKGKELYARNCLACHGATGDGKGPVASRLGFSAGDLTRSPEMAQRTDGELFWKIATGRDPMPSFRKPKGLTDSQIWDVVNYIRTLARK